MFYVIFVYIKYRNDIIKYNNKEVVSGGYPNGNKQYRIWRFSSDETMR